MAPKTATNEQDERLARRVFIEHEAGKTPTEVGELFGIDQNLVNSILAGKRLSPAVTNRQADFQLKRCKICGVKLYCDPCLECELIMTKRIEFNRRRLLRSAPAATDNLRIRPSVESGTIHVRAESHNADDRSFDAVLISERQTISMDAWTLEAVADVVLMDGVTFVDPFPIVDSHVASLYSIVPTTEIRGHIVDIRDEVVDGHKAKVGTLLFDKDEASEALYQKVLSGSVKNLSPGYTITRGVELSPGETATVNGRTFTAPDDMPLLIGTVCTVTEESAVLRGADPTCRIRAAKQSKVRGDCDPISNPPSQSEKNMPSELKKYLVRCGLVETATDAEAETFLASLQGEQLNEAKRIRSAGANQNPNPAPHPVDADRIRTAERQRISRIEELAGDDTPRELVRSAIDQGWDEGRASTAFLQAMRDRRSNGGLPAGAPAGHVRSGNGPNVRSLVLSQLMRAGIQPDSEILARSNMRSRLYEFDAESLSDEARAIRTSGRFSDAYSRDVDMANDMMYSNPLDFARHLLRSQGIDEPLSAKDLIRTAFSSGNLAGVLDTIVSARMAMGFEGAADWTRGFVAEGSNNDLNAAKRIVVGANGRMVSMPRGATPHIIALGDNAPTVQSDRKSAAIILDEIDLINGSWGELEGKAMEQLWKVAVAVRAEIVISMLLRAETQLYSFDSAAVASVGRKNLITGAVMDASNLEAARALMTTATFQGRPAIHVPRFLVTPEAMWGQANRLLNSTEVRSTASETTVEDAVLTPTSNSAVRAMNLRHLSDGRFDAGCPDPNDAAGTAIVTGDNDRFYLCAGEESSPIELTGVNGQGQGGAPILESGQLEGGARGLRFTAVSFIQGNWINPNGLVVLRP